MRNLLILFGIMLGLSLISVNAQESFLKETRRKRKSEKEARKTSRKLSRKGWEFVESTRILKYEFVDYYKKEALTEKYGEFKAISIEHAPTQNFADTKSMMIGIMRFALNNANLVKGIGVNLQSIDGLSKRDKNAIDETINRYLVFVKANCSGIIEPCFSLRRKTSRKSYEYLYFFFIRKDIVKSLSDKALDIWFVMKSLLLFIELIFVLVLKGQDKFKVEIPKDEHIIYSYFISKKKYDKTDKTDKTL